MTWIKAWNKADPKLGDLTKFIQESKDDCGYVKDILYKKHVLSFIPKSEKEDKNNEH